MANLISVFNTEFLRNVLTTLTNDVNPSVTIHVGSVDSWPSAFSPHKNTAMIFNTDYIGEIGEHWVAVFIDCLQKEIYYFDSLPDRPFPQNVLYKLGKIGFAIHNTNPQRYQFQQRLLPLCGIYCLAFLDHFSKNKPFRLCYNNTLLNDITVLDHVFPFIVASME